MMTLNPGSHHKGLLCEPHCLDLSRLFTAQEPLAGGLVIHTEPPLGLGPTSHGFLLFCQLCLPRTLPFPRRGWRKWPSSRWVEFYLLKLHLFSQRLDTAFFSPVGRIREENMCSLYARYLPFCFFSFWPCHACLRDLSSLTKDRTRAHCSKKCWVLTTGPPGNSQVLAFLLVLVFIFGFGLFYFIIFISQIRVQKSMDIRNFKNPNYYTACKSVILNIIIITVYV